LISPSSERPQESPRIEPPDIQSILDPLFEPVKFVELPACECFKRLRATASTSWGLLPDTLLHFARLAHVSDAILWDLETTHGGASSGSDLEQYARKAARSAGRGEARLRHYASDIHDSRSRGAWTSRRRGRVLIGIQLARTRLKKLLESYLFCEALSPFEFARRTGVVQLWVSPKSELRVKCPVCDQEVYLSDELRMYLLLRSLSRTFEFQRLRWLHMTSALHFSHAASTHTRYAHGVGTAMTALSAMEHVTILPAHNHAQSLGLYLASRGLVDEFFCANLLHDIGHPPHSHVLEKNPVVVVDHEGATRSLLSGDAVMGPHGEYSWHTWLEYFVSIHAREEDDSGPSTQQEAAPALLREVLANCGVDPRKATEMLTPADFGMVPFDSRDDGDLALMRSLTDSDLDIDRIDHIRRDSVTTGLSLSDLRERELLQGLAIWFELNPLSTETIRLGECTPPGDASEVTPQQTEGNVQVARDRMAALGRYFPWVLVSKESLPFWLDLLNCRELTNTHVFNAPSNRFMCGVLNFAVACAVVRFPHLQAVLPVITDQILSHVLSSPSFRNTLVESLNRILQGKVDACAYHPPITFSLCPEVGTEREWLRKLYRDVADFDSQVAQEEVPIAQALGSLAGSHEALNSYENEEVLEALDRVLYRATGPPLLFYADLEIAKATAEGTHGRNVSPNRSDDGGQPAEFVRVEHLNQALQADALEELPWKSRSKSHWAPNLVLRQARADLLGTGTVHHRFADLHRRGERFCHSRTIAFPDKPLGRHFDKTLTIWVGRDFTFREAQLLMRIMRDRPGRVAPRSGREP